MRAAGEQATAKPSGRQFGVRRSVDARINRQNAGDEFYTPEGCYIIELSNTADDPDVSIARARVEPGVTTRWHRLHNIVERYVIVEGHGSVEIGNLPPAEVGVGDTVLIPPMCRQRISNTGRADLVFLAICSPRFTDAAYEDIDNEDDRRRKKMLEKKQLAPEFRAPDQDGYMVDLADYRDKNNIVLYFYPKDDTTGCTIEARQFTELAGEFADLDTVVIGVSKDSCDSHRAFIEKYGLNVKLLSDTSGQLCESYDVWREKEKNGARVMGIVRSTFIINRQGVLEDVMYGVDADGHAQAVLDKLKRLEQAD